MRLKTATIAPKVTSRVSELKPIAQTGRALVSIVTMIFFLSTSLVFPRQGLAQDPLTGAAIISEANSVIGQLNTLGANLGGDFSIATGGTAGQLSALLSQFKGIIGENVTAPLNSLGLDAQNLGRQIHAGVGQLNQILSQQRNCGVANAEALISGLRNVAQGTLASVPLVRAGDPRIDYIQFAGHDPEVIPQAGGRATVYGYLLYSGKAPTVALWDDAGHSIANLAADRAQSDDAFAVNISGANLTSHAGQALLLDIHTHKPTYVLGFIPTGENTSELKLNIVVPQAYETKYKFTAKTSYSCNASPTTNLPGIPIHFENRACESGQNVTDTRTPPLPSGPGITDAAIVGYHFAGGPSAVNVTHIGVSYTATTITASGSLDTASCINTPFSHSLLHDTHWDAVLVPEVRYTQAVEHDETAGPTLVSASLPTTNVNLSIPSACFEPGSKTFSYVVTPVINGVEQNPLYTSPNQTGSEHGVTDQANLGGVTINGQWNPTPIAGVSQVSISLSAPACGN
jgi:hypothetical protein